MLSIFYYLLVLLICDSTALTLMKQYSISKNIYTLIIAMLIYGIAIPTLIIKNLQYEGIGIVNLLWNILSTTAMLVIGTLYFKEKITSVQKVGLVLGVCAIVLLLHAELVK